VIDVQMCVQHVIDIFGLHASSYEALQIWRIQLMTNLKLRPLFIVACTSVNQDGMVRRTDEPTMDTLN